MMLFNFEPTGRPVGLRNIRRISWLVLLAMLFWGCAPRAEAVTVAKTNRHKRTLRKSPPVRLATYSASKTRAGVIHTASYLRHMRSRHRVLFNPWTEPTFADSTTGDNIDGDDLVIRKAAADALGPYNGTIVVADPQTGRILTMVNQKLGLKGAFQPCSTVKVVVSFASLREAIVDATTPVRLAPRFSLDMTNALAHSNNRYFAHLGEQLGFERVEKYAKMFGLGEKAGYEIDGEEPGYLADAPPKTGVGMMTSFGDGIRVTPLELTSILSAIANGGTLYYLQYPKNQMEVTQFVPRVKRQLDIAPYIPEVKPGMMGAVEYGTARRGGFDQTDPVLGKTGTCTDTVRPGVHLGWFGSYNEVGRNRIAVVVLLTGGRGVAGPVAAKVAGSLYHELAIQNYFGLESASASTKLVSMQNCCRQ